MKIAATDEESKKTNEIQEIEIPINNSIKMQTNSQIKSSIFLNKAPSKITTFFVPQFFKNSSFKLIGTVIQSNVPWFVFCYYQENEVIEKNRGKKL